MRKITIIFCLLVNTCFSQKAEFKTLLLEGLYTGENVFVKNPYGKGGIGYCVAEVLVNDKITTDKINDEIFQVVLDKSGLKKGEKLKIELRYQTDCIPFSAPAIINPGVLQSSGDKERTLVIEGKFHWKNIFIGNLSGIKEISINGTLITYDIKQELFEIDLNSMGVKGTLKEDEDIKIIFKYNGQHAPIIFNPEVLK
jgi:hypothetical protein